MKWLTVELIKKNSRIDGDYEDSIIDLYGESAEEQVLNDTMRTYEELVEIGGGKLPAPIIHASLMLADFAYRQKSPADSLNWSVVPYTYDRLIKPYIRLAERKENEKE